ncbi:nuclear transport factor 2 family protein [Streptomyces umbrinus]|uniref:nuclear transport factor 2 family protein n=1 Tax=Streptomyces umbrinus TaxID=67370 RepID=UPI0033E9E4BE
MSDERKVQEVLAHYVRAADRRDGKSQGALFTDDAIVDVFVKTGPDAYEKVGEPIVGGAGVAYAVDNFMAPHPEGGSSHHVTADHLIEVDGDEAHMNAHFVVFEVRALSRPAGGWPEDAFGAQGTIRPIESGYYDTDLHRIDGEWKIVRHRVLHDMPYAVLEA